MSDYHEPDINGVLQKGACRFCGQLTDIRLLGILNKEEANDYASRNCTCDESKRYREKELSAEQRRKRREDALKRASEEIQNLCGEGAEKLGLSTVISEIIILMPKAAELIYDDKMKDITFGVSPRIKVKISKSAKGIIEIKRTNTEALKREA